MRILGIVLAMVLCFPGCSSDDERADDPPITERAIAAVALELLPSGTESRRVADGLDQDQAVGAALRYPGPYGDEVIVSVSPDRSSPCDPEVEFNDLLSGCETREVAGGTLALGWVNATPEEDPGYIRVAFIRDHEAVRVSYSGEDIDGDPRDLVLRVPVAALEAVATDNRLSLRTAQEVVDLGAKVERWGGGEPESVDTTLDEACREVAQVMPELANDRDPTGEELTVLLQRLLKFEARLDDESYSPFFNVRVNTEDYRSTLEDGYLVSERSWRYAVDVAASACAMIGSSPWRRIRKQNLEAVAND